MSENEQIILLLVKVVKNLKKLRKQKRSRPKLSDVDYNPADWGLMEDVFKILSISKSTLYRYRAQKKVCWDQKGGISYYYLPDLLKLKYRCMK
ncbi:MAG: hypothetical protein V4721_01420 [Bacteroidota bacterium]